MCVCVPVAVPARPAARAPRFDWKKERESGVFATGRVRACVLPPSRTAGSFSLLAWRAGQEAWARAPLSLLSLSPGGAAWAGRGRCLFPSRHGWRGPGGPALLERSPLAQPLPCTLGQGERQRREERARRARSCTSRPPKQKQENAQESSTWRWRPGRPPPPHGRGFGRRRPCPGGGGGAGRGGGWAGGACVWAWRAAQPPGHARVRARFEVRERGERGARRRERKKRAATSSPNLHFFPGARARAQARPF